MTNPGVGTHVVEPVQSIRLDADNVMALWEASVAHVLDVPESARPKMAVCLEDDEPRADARELLHRAGIPPFVVPEDYRHLDPADLAARLTDVMQQLVPPDVSPDESETGATRTNGDEADVYAQPHREPSAAARAAMLRAINDRSSEDDGLR